MGGGAESQCKMPGDREATVWGCQCNLHSKDPKTAFCDQGPLATPDN